MINWAKLVEQNRVKAMGIPWTEEELDAIYNKGLSPDDVRNGFFGEEVESDEDKPVHHWVKDKLVEKAKELGISFDEKVVQRGELIIEINKIIKENGEKNTEG